MAIGQKRNAPHLSALQKSSLERAKNKEKIPSLKLTLDGNGGFIIIDCRH
jgi:hypothetical protein